MENAIEKVYIKMQFDPNVAKDVGVDCAIMLANIEFWCAKNKANKRNFHDDLYWTYNSQEAFCELFPFWSRTSIRRILKKLEDKKYILSGQYNKLKYDRTKWYAINPQIDWSKLTNGGEEINQPIPYNKPDKIDIVENVSLPIGKSLNSTKDSLKLKANKKKADKTKQAEEKKKLHSECVDLIDYWEKKYTTGIGTEPFIGNYGRYIKQSKPLVKKFGIKKMKKLCDIYFTTFDNDLIEKNKWSLSMFLSDYVINKLNF